MGLLSSVFGGDVNAARETAPAQPVEPYTTSIWQPVAQAGVHVNEYTALRYSAVWRAIDVIAGTISTLPFHVLRDRGDGRQDMDMDHPLNAILRVRVNGDFLTPSRFKWLLQAHALTWGDGYAEIERARNGRAVALWPITPDRVHVDRDDRGNLVYEVANDRQANAVLPAGDMFHLRGPSYDGVQGYTVARLAAESFGLGIAMEKFAAAFFGNGAQLSGVLKHPSTLSADAAERIRNSFRSKHGGPDKAGGVAVLEEGMEYQSTSVSAKEAQMVEARAAQVKDVARWFGVPPQKLMESADVNRSTAAEENRAFASDAIKPWAINWEQEASVKLFPASQLGRRFVHIDLDALLRGDPKSKAETNQIKFDRGVLSVNDWLRDDGRNEIGADGDLRVVPKNMTSLQVAARDGDTGTADFSRQTDGGTDDGTS